MNNDIKEILDKLKECANVNEKFYPAEVLKIGKNNLQKISIYNGHAKILLDYITNLQEIRKEHSIMKQFIYENGLWEKFLNDDRFLEHLRSDDNER